MTAASVPLVITADDVSAAVAAVATVAPVAELDAFKPTSSASSAAAPGASSAMVAAKAGAATVAGVPPKGARSPRTRRDSTEARSAFEWLDDEPAEFTESPDDTVAAARVRRRAVVISAIALAVLGLGGAIAYKLAYAPHRSRPPGATPTATAPETESAPGRSVTAATAQGSGSAAAAQSDLQVIAPLAAPGDGSAAATASGGVTPAPSTPAARDAVASATAVLAGFLDTGSTRDQRAAAVALARTGDPRAIAVLKAQLAAATERVTAAGAGPGADSASTDLLAKLGLARALAQAGDPAGEAALVESMAAPHRDEVRLEAARQLAKLGDARAVPVLAELLGTKGLELSAAELLAGFRDPGGLAVLDRIRANPTAKLDERTRATIALGVAGRATVAPELVALLDREPYAMPAAAALAGLHDESVRAKLVTALAVHAQRVPAAAALRRLDPARDLSDTARGLLPDLKSSNDLERIRAADAILRLVGPAVRHD